MRGDVPLLTNHCDKSRPFSPRARGCSLLINSWVPGLNVFPACAGMFRIGRGKHIVLLSFPRVRGDVPENLMKLSELTRFSPRARGCSHCGPKPLECTGVFPACAGMFPHCRHRPRPRGRFPRVRGDVPGKTYLFSLKGAFSPRARGCSPVQAGRPFALRVFPACAGMFLGGCGRWRAGVGFPRVRGDVPAPHAHHRRPCVFPACAGMFPGTFTQAPELFRFPRVRGDVPLN